jgi:hypothetical protein
MVLIGLIQSNFFENLETKEFPNHVIQVSKQDLLKFETVSFNADQMKRVNLTYSKIDLSNVKCLSKLFDY